VPVYHRAESARWHGARLSRATNPGLAVLAALLVACGAAAAPDETVAVDATGIHRR